VWLWLLQVSGMIGQVQDWGSLLKLGISFPLGSSHRSDPLNCMGHSMPNQHEESMTPFDFVGLHMDTIMKLSPLSHFIDLSLRKL